MTKLSLTPAEVRKLLGLPEAPLWEFNGNLFYAKKTTVGKLGVRRVWKNCLKKGDKILLDECETHQCQYLGCNNHAVYTHEDIADYFCYTHMMKEVKLSGWGRNWKAVGMEKIKCTGKPRLVVVKALAMKTEPPSGGSCRKGLRPVAVVKVEAEVD